MKQTYSTIEQTFREESGRVLAALISYLGDFELAEDALQEALVVALERWPADGIPNNPGAWLTTAARRKAIDRLRRRQTYGRKEEILKADLLQKQSEVDEPEMRPIPDERLKLIFTCCHPALALEAQVALTLHTLGGLDTAEIASAFLLPEAMGLLALMLLHHSRHNVRVDGAGVLLEDQNRALWDEVAIAEGIKLVETALRLGRPGAYQIQAAIAAVHAEAKTAVSTNWLQISALYQELFRFQPTPVVALNHAVAVAMADGPMRGLALLDRLAEEKMLAQFHLYHAARADLLRRAGWLVEAKTAYEQALALCQNGAEQRFLRRRISEMEIRD